ncbi:Hsp70 chaperone protein [Fusarium mundagurra]|uniref:Hsp70 chaperone protein n=1 Tax=Fusarium mundagurra TaxID=1567541 RepID=A0A8H6D9C8_9HYPO|nr:Hsp70 chaperone protein [Fusarium mundagurra]
MSDGLVKGMADQKGKPMLLEAEDRVVISLDFGTTFSGIAYAFCNPEKKPEITTVVDWPGLQGRTQPKIPSVLSYTPGDANQFKWGGQLNWKDDCVHGVKLLLDPDQPEPLYLPAGNKKKEIKRLPKEPVDVASDFIGAIYTHAMAKIESKVPRDYFLLCQKQFVLTVPAAAKKAGIHPVSLIKEPEAAALYTMYCQERALGIGDAFVLCDAGGGTVDLITYEVISTTGSLQLAEVVPGSGGMAGSLGLNKRFAEAVQDLVGEEEWIKLKKLKGWTNAYEQFDQLVKRCFLGDTEEEYLITFPQAGLEDNPPEGLKNDCWAMTGATVKQIFDPLVNDILRLVDEQIKNALIKRQGRDIKGIFLVGGFGASQYLKECIQKAHPDVQVIQPDDAWAAILKGAVLSRLPHQAAVVETKARHHYGVAALSIYEPAIDKGRPTEMTWYIYIGESLKRDQTIKFPFYRTLNADYGNDDLIFTDKLITCDSPIPPNHPTQETKENCTLQADLRDVDRALFKQKTGIGGLTYYEVHYDLAVSTQDANMKFSLEFQGKEAGSVNPQYN